MLGLGLAISVGKRILGDAIDSLLSTLRGRATYFENSSASKSTIKAIDNADILDKASILLTPTATSDARVHSVKTYTGDELITNGDFSNWTGDNPDNYLVLNEDANNYVTESNGQLRMVSDDSATIAIRPQPTTMLSTDNTYRISVDLTFTTGTLNISGVEFNTSGTKVFYLTPPSTYLQLAKGSALDVLIDNLSVVDVSSDFDFDRASSATRINSSGLVQDMQSITDPELVLNGDFEELGSEVITNGTFDADSDWSKSGSWTYDSLNQSYKTTNNSISSLQQNGVTEIGKTYKLTFNVSSAPNGFSDFRIINSAWSDTYVDANEAQLGENTFYINVVNGTGIRFRVENLYEIDNVSVKEVDPNDRWSLTQATITDGSLNLSTSDGSYTAATQTLGTIGNVYEISLDVSDIVGTISVAIGGGTDVDITTNGTHTVYITSASTTFEIKRKFGITNVSATIDNISVKDITFSTDVDLARINYDSNGDNGHILLEPTSTNLITYSEDFDDTTSDWTNTNISVETNSTISPQGINNAAKITEDTSNSEHQIQFVFSQTINTNYSYSVFVKANGRDYFGMNIGASRLYANFDLTDGSVTNVQSNGTDFNNESASITSFGNGWYKCTLSGYALTTNGSYIRFALRNIESTSSSLNYLGDGTSGAYLWGAQLEELSYATSYIPTLTGSTVTRATETLTGSGNSTLINSTEGVLYTEIAALADDGTIRYMGLNDGSSDNRVIILNDGTANRIRGIVSSGGTKYVDFAYDVTDVTDFHKVAVKYKANDFALWVDGVERATDTSGSAPIGLNDLEFDLNSGGAFYGKCKALAVFNEALSDTELENLTS